MNLNYSTYATVLAEYSFYLAYLLLPSVRHALHVGDREYIAQSHKVQSYLRRDIFKPLTKKLTQIIDNNYRVLLYNGNFDLLTTVHGINLLLTDSSKF